MGSEKTLKKVILILLVVSILSSVSFAYPVIVSERGVNHTQIKELVYSIPEEYFKYVDVIEFVNEPLKVAEDGEVKRVGTYMVFRTDSYVCYNGKIKLWDYSDSKITVIHEIGHSYEFCELKKDYSTEEFADNFVIR